MPSVSGITLKPNTYLVAYNGVGNNLTTFTPSLNSLYFVQFVATYDTTMAAIGVVVIVANATAKCRVGFYASDSDGYQTGSPLVDSGDLLGSTTGYKSIAVSLTLSKGVQYWAAFVNQTTLTTWRATPQANLNAIAHVPTLSSTYNHVYVDNITGALPSVPAVTLLGRGNAPSVWMQG